MLMKLRAEATLYRESALFQRGLAIVECPPRTSAAQSATGNHLSVRPDGLIKTNVRTPHIISVPNDLRMARQSFDHQAQLNGYMPLGLHESQDVVVVHKTEGMFTHQCGLTKVAFLSLMTLLPRRGSTATPAG